MDRLKLPEGQSLSSVSKDPHRLFSKASYATAFMHRGWLGVGIEPPTSETWMRGVQKKTHKCELESVHDTDEAADWILKDMAGVNLSFYY